MVRSVMTVLALIIFPGLMAGQQPVLEAPVRATLEEVVRFDYDEAAITAEADLLLREKLPILINSPTIRLRLEGHADERGSAEYNLALGSRRAESVRVFLTGLGISTDRLTTTSFGEERPVANQSDEASWAQNRRVEFVITGIPEPAVVAIDPTDPVIVEPEPAVVGDVTVDAPAGDAPPPVVRTRPNLERDRRSRFYRDPNASALARVSNAPDELWVARSSTWSAEWIGAASLEEVEFDGPDRVHHRRRCRPNGFSLYLGATGSGTGLPAEAGGRATDIPTGSGQPRAGRCAAPGGCAIRDPGRA